MPKAIDKEYLLTQLKNFFKIKLSNMEITDNKVTSIGSSPTDKQYPSAKAVKDYIDALPEPMVFKGSLGTGGTITALPAAAASNEGFTYKVITAGTYQGIAADVGDTFISDGATWVLIPSGDEPSGTVTSVAATGSNGIKITGSPITSSGTIAIAGTNVSQTTNGMMTAADKKKLDSVYNYGECSTARNVLEKEVTINNITSLYAGLKVVIRFTDTGTANPASGTLTLNINGLGAKDIVDAKSNKVKMTYANSGWLCNNMVSEFVYDGTAWAWVSRDNNTTNTAGSANKVNTKMFLVGTASQAHGVTSYSNKNCYIGTDNELYSAGKKVAHDTNATQSVSGLMSADDKKKLDNISLIDDTTGTAYTLGINNGILYIKEVTS